jgi:hypothetical protein
MQICHLADLSGKPSRENGLFLFFCMRVTVGRRKKTGKRHLILKVVDWKLIFLALYQSTINLKRRFIF